MRVGDLEIVPVHDGTGREPARESLSRPGVDDPWACHQDLLADNGDLVLPLGGFLLRTADRTVLVDAGAGRIDNAKYHGGGFLDGLLAEGVTPDDITDVVFTHLHFDHVGWATQQGRIVFPNATYRAHSADLHHFLTGPDANPGAVRKLAPLAGRWEPFHTDTAVAPGLFARHTPGHTPGSTVYVVDGGGERAVLLGDVVHSVVELTEPDWEAVFDVDPAAAKAVRARLADELADSGDPVVGAHFPELRFGRLVTVAGARRFVAI